MRLPPLCLLTVLLMSACGAGPRVPAQDVTISDCLNPEGGPDVEIPPQELLLTGADRAIVVAHRSHPLDCGHDIEIDARLDEDAGTITVTYEDQADDSTDCECVYDLGYTLTPVERGVWTVYVPGNQQAQVEAD